MKSAIGVAALGLSLLTATPAYAGQRPARLAGDIKFDYGAPVVDRDSVTWTWTLTNTGDAPADNVLLQQWLNPVLKVIRIDKPCLVITVESARHADPAAMGTKQTIRCLYGSVPAGETRKGALTIALPAKIGGTVELSGRVSWQQAMSPVSSERAARMVGAR